MSTDKLEFVPVFAMYYGQFYICERTDRDPLIVTKTLKSLLGEVKRAVDKMFNVFAKRESLEKLLNGDDVAEVDESAAHTFIVLNSKKAVPFIWYIAFCFDRVMFRFQPVSFRKGDIIFLPDEFCPVLMDTLKRGSLPETIHIVLIHDILPVLYPQFFRKENVDVFLKNIPYIVKWADGILSVSQSSLDAIANYGAHLGCQPMYNHFHPGADFNLETETIGVVRPLFKDIFNGSVTYLMVGTIEPRKNHRYVLETFRRLWDNNVDVKLCIVGKVGWKCKETIEEIYASPQFKERLFMISDATDEELNYCYNNAKAVIIASFAEGFGLPLVEALYFGKKVFASDIPVFREVGREYPAYFSLDDPQRLVDSILDFEICDSELKKEKYQPLSWDESITDLFGKIAKMADAIESRKHLRTRADSRGTYEGR